LRSFPPRPRLKFLQFLLARRKKSHKKFLGRNSEFLLCSIMDF